MSTPKKFDLDAVRGKVQTAIRNGQVQGYSNDASADFIARQIEMLDTQYYAYPLPPLEMSDLLSAKDLGAGFSSYKYVKFGQYGKMNTAPVSDIVNESLPIIESDTLACKWHHTKVRYTTDDMRKAEQASVPLEEWYLMAGRNTLLQGMEKIWAVGDTELRLPGLFTSAGGSLAAGATGTGTVNTNWFGPTASNPTGMEQVKTGAEILCDIQSLKRKVLIDSFGAHKVNAIVLPLGYPDLMKTAPWTASSPKSVWEVITSQNPDVKFTESRWLIPGGVTTVNRMFAFQNDPLTVQRVLGLVPALLPAQFEGFNINIPMEAYSGGVALRFPKSAVCMDGI